MDSPTPIQEIRLPILLEKSVRLFIKREDLNHSLIQGNKWRKLKYNLERASFEGKDTLLTFGGAFSNHIHATAALGKQSGFKTIGIIRGEKPEIPNPTLSDAEAFGMSFHFVTRSLYRDKYNPDFIEELKQTFGDFYLIPEGGTNEYAIKGCGEMMEELETECPTATHIAVPVGTGGTIAGMIRNRKNIKMEIIGFSSLKGDFIQKDIRKLLDNDFPNWSVNTDYHFGGYARHTSELIEFVNRFKKETKIQLEPIYTGKMMFGVLDKIKQGYYPKGSNIITIHTGGLQGIRGFNQRFGNLLVE